MSFSNRIYKMQLSNSWWLCRQAGQSKGRHWPDGIFDISKSSMIAVWQAVSGQSAASGDGVGSRYYSRLDYLGKQLYLLQAKPL